MSLLKGQGYEVSLVACRPLGEYIRPPLRRNWKERRRIIQKQFGLDIILLPSPPSRATWLWRERISLAFVLRRFAKNFDNVVVHCRGSRAADMVLRATRGDLRFSVVFDCRGINYAEMLYVNGFNGEDGVPEQLLARAKHLEDIERRAATDCRRMICVSDAMKGYVAKYWAVPPQKVEVIPCSTDVEAGISASMQRVSLRNKLGLQGLTVVTYCGSLAKWQMPMESLRIFRQIATMRSNAHFLGVTTQPEKLEAYADQAGICPNRRTIVSVDISEVPGYLAASDIGLLVREPSVVNFVASPVKFAEYLSCGVPVLITDEVGDYSDLVREKSVGVVYSYGENVDNVVERITSFLDVCDSEEVRQRCKQLARERFSYKENIVLLEGVYHQIFPAV